MSPSGQVRRWGHGRTNDEPCNDIGLMCTIEVKAVVTVEYLSGFGCHYGAAAQETESEVLSAGDGRLTVPVNQSRLSRMSFLVCERLPRQTIIGKGEIRQKE